LDRKTSMRDDPPDVARFEAVHVCARAMDFLADIVASAMNEVFCETGLADHFARGAIHLPAFDRSTGGHTFLYKLTRRIASLTDNRKNLRTLLGNFFTQKPNPGYVVIDAIRRLRLRPNVQQQEIAAPHGRRTLLSRLVMRISCVRPDGHDRRGIRNYSVGAKLIEDPLLQIEFGE